jgi:arsenate reductase-like glutaredoxin family protein
MKSSEIVIYGIPNCDSIKKTIDWLNENQITFHVVHVSDEFGTDDLSFYSMWAKSLLMI